MRISAGNKFKMELHDAIMAEVDHKKRGCPACGAKPLAGDLSGYVPHVLGECLLMAVLERVESVVSKHAGKSIKL